VVEPHCSAGLNTYAYARSNPVTVVDLSGLDSTAAFITCDSNGNSVPRYFPLGEPDRKCGVMKCVQEHEMQHIRDIAPFGRKLCRFVTPGDPISLPSRTRAQTEANAYQVSVDCLTKLFQGASWECKPRIRQLIDVAAQKRDQFRRQFK
jgi:hypothetical protein